MAKAISHQDVQITDPPFVTKLFSDTRLSPIWLVVRVWLGWQWLEAGWEKFNAPGGAWIGTGAALKGFWANQIATGAGTAHPAIAFDWYRQFLQILMDAQAYTWFAKLVVAGEMLVGVALILGIFTGIAAFLGGFMNWNFMMAGSASVNPLFFIASVVLILAWKTAGYIGVDRWLLPLLGTPWRPAFTLKRVEPSPEPSPAH